MAGPFLVVGVVVVGVWFVLVPVLCLGIVPANAPIDAIRHADAIAIASLFMMNLLRFAVAPRPAARVVASPRAAASVRAC
jgi:hypothetical protein